MNYNKYVSKYSEFNISWSFFHNKSEWLGIVFKAINDWLCGSQMRLQWLLHLEATCDLINCCLQNSLVPLWWTFLWFRHYRLTFLLFQASLFHLQKKNYFQYWDFPKYILTSACYNNSNFLYLRTAISWLCMFCTWDEKIHFTIIYDCMYTCASGWRVMCTCMQTPQRSKELDGLD